MAASLVVLASTNSCRSSSCFLAILREIASATSLGNWIWPMSTLSIIIGVPLKCAAQLLGDELAHLRGLELDVGRADTRVTCSRTMVRSCS
jgi:hypothetical protein